MAEHHQKMGMSIDIWGPAAWSFLQTSAFAYGKNPEQATETEQEHARTFFYTLPYMLPCSICRKHYLEHIEKHPPAVENRDALTRWIVKIHNIVNVNNGKPIMSYEKVREHYMGGRQWLSPEKENKELCALRSKAQITEYACYGLGAILLLLLGYLVFKKRKSTNS